MSDHEGERDYDDADDQGRGNADDHGHSEGHDHDDADDHGHDHHHHDVAELGVAVLTVSSSRSLDNDPAGDAIADIVEGAGHEVSMRELVRDEYDGVQDAINRFVDRDDTDCVISTGGTGVTPDDVTVEAVDPLFDKQLPGFGELFRTLSYEDIGAKVVGNRAVAGVADGVPVFCLPGSENAARVGTGDIIIEEAPHLAGLARTGEEPTD